MRGFPSEAMRRDLNLDDAQVARLRTDAAAPVIEKRLRAGLGDDFTGAWITEGATRLTVAVTDPPTLPWSAPKAPTTTSPLRP